jgi:crotonobetainyl-CoA:carnitine CoA-transferase CaiB-like acyl-CoA transferase
VSAGAILDELLSVAARGLAAPGPADTRPAHPGPANPGPAGPARAAPPPAEQAGAGITVTLRGADPVFPTPPRVGELGAAAIAASAWAAARLLAQRTGAGQEVTVDVDAAAAAMRSWTYLADVLPAGTGTGPGAVPRPSGGAGPQLFFATGDGRWIFLHRRAAHHAARQERVLGCGSSDQAVAAAVRRWKGADLE